MKMKIELLVDVEVGPDMPLELSKVTAVSNYPEQNSDPLDLLGVLPLNVVEDILYRYEYAKGMR